MNRRYESPRFSATGLILALIVAMVAPASSGTPPLPAFATRPSAPER
jgi:hypothetical protein